MKILRPRDHGTTTDGTTGHDDLVQYVEALDTVADRLGQAVTPQEVLQTAMDVVR